MRVGCIDFRKCDVIGLCNRLFRRIFRFMRHCLRAILILMMLASVTEAQHGTSRTVLKGLSDAVAIDVSPAGELFVLESGRSRVLKVSPDGTRLDSLGNRGSGDYQFDRPAGLDVTNGMKIYVSDPSNRRIQTFDRRNQFLGGITSSSARGLPFEPHKVRVTPRGDVVAWVPSEGTFVRFGNQGRVDVEIGPIQRYNIGVVTDYLIDNRHLFVLDGRAGLLHRFTVEGEYLQMLAGYSDGVAMAHHGDQLYVLTPRHILLCNAAGKIESKLDIPLRQYVGIQIWGGEAFLLTSANLYAVKLP